MDLDELKSVWASLDRRLALQNTLALEQRRAEGLSRVARSLRPLLVGQVVQVVAGVAVCLLFAPFWVAHRHEVHLLLCGLMLHAYGVWLIISAGRELHLIGRVRSDGPVLEVQKRVATLRRWRVRIAPLHGVAGCVVWVPLVLVVFKWLGADVWRGAPAVVGWLALSAAVCLVVYGVALWWNSRRASSAVRACMENATVGGGVSRAGRLLEEIAAFEREWDTPKQSDER